MVSVMSGNDEEREARIAADIRARNATTKLAEMSLEQRVKILMQRLGVLEDAEIRYAPVPMLEKLTDRLEALERRHESNNKQQQSAT